MKLLLGFVLLVVLIQNSSQKEVTEVTKVLLPPQLRYEEIRENRQYLPREAKDGDELEPPDTDFRLDEEEEKAPPVSTKEVTGSEQGIPQEDFRLETPENPEVEEAPLPNTKEVDSGTESTSGTSVTDQFVSALAEEAGTQIGANLVGQILGKPTVIKPEVNYQPTFVQPIVRPEHDDEEEKEEEEEKKKKKKKKPSKSTQTLPVLPGYYQGPYPGFPGYSVNYPKYDPAYRPPGYPIAVNPYNSPYPQQIQPLGSHHGFNGPVYNQHQYSHSYPGTTVPVSVNQQYGSLSQGYPVGSGSNYGNGYLSQGLPVYNSYPSGGLNSATSGYSGFHPSTSYGSYPTITLTTGVSSAYFPGFTRETIEPEDNDETVTDDLLFRDSGSTTSSKKKGGNKSNLVAPLFALGAGYLFYNHIKNQQNQQYQYPYHHQGAYPGYHQGYQGYQGYPNQGYNNHVQYQGYQGYPSTGYQTSYPGSATSYTSSSYPSSSYPVTTSYPSSSYQGPATPTFTGNKQYSGVGAVYGRENLGPGLRFGKNMKPEAEDIGKTKTREKREANQVSVGEGSSTPLQNKPTEGTLPSSPQKSTMNENVRITNAQPGSKEEEGGEVVHTWEIHPIFAPQFPVGADTSLGHAHFSPQGRDKRKPLAAYAIGGLAALALANHIYKKPKPRPHVYSYPAYQNYPPRPQPPRPYYGQYQPSYPTYFGNSGGFINGK